MLPKFLTSAKKDDKVPAKAIYYLPVCDEQPVYKECTTQETTVAESKKGASVFLLSLSSIFIIGIVGFGVMQSGKLFAESPIQIVTRSRPFTIHENHLRHNGTLEDTGDRFLVFNFPVELVLLRPSSASDPVTIRRVTVDTYRNTHLIGQRSDYLGVEIDARLETITTIGTIFLRGKPAEICDSTGSSFVVVSVYMTVEIGTEFEKTSFYSGSQKYIVCCSENEVCSRRSAITRYVF